MNKQRLGLASGTVAGALLFFILFSWLRFLVTLVITDEHGLRYDVPPGVTLQRITNDLYYKNIIDNRLYFIFLAHLKGQATQIKAGEYLFPAGTTPGKLLNQVATGSGLVYHLFILVPGWTFKQMMSELEHDPNLQHTLQGLSNKEIMQRLGYPDVFPEGNFFPDTYYFAKGSPDIVVLKRAYAAMQMHLTQAWQQRSGDLPWQTPYDALIAASIIEKEAYFDEERPVIAGVMINRLRKDMMLQFDPTVIYGLGSHYNGRLGHFNIFYPSPYNTYLHKGLPPTPICMPSLESIMAAVQPQQNKYLYFVARGDGSHQFSENYADHAKAIKAAKYYRRGFFNTDLVSYYLLKYISPPL